MKNFKNPGQYLSVVCSSPVTPASGDPVRFGNLTGIACQNEGAGGNVATKTTVYFGHGVFSLSVVDAGGGGIAAGAALFLHDGAPCTIDGVSTAGYFFGFALAAVAAGQTATIDVLHVASPAAGALGAGTVGAVQLADDGVTNDKLANITRGSIKVGGVANAPTDLDAKGDGKILVGDGTDVKSVSVTVDISLTNAGVARVLKLGVSPKGTVVAQANNVVLLAADLDKIHTNTGAGAGITVTLPAAAGVAGKFVKLVATAAQTIQAVPAAGDKIYYGGSGVADKYAQLAGVIGNFMDLMSDGTDWLVINANGVVTKQA